MNGTSGVDPGTGNSIPDSAEKKSATRYSLGIWLAVIAALGFSFKAILIKLAYAVPQEVPIDAVSLLTLRMLFALPFFFWLFRSSDRSGQKLTHRDIVAIVILGLFGYYGASIFDFFGLVYISAGLERIILFTYPILTLLFESLFCGKQVKNYERLAVVICYAGIGLAFLHDLGTNVEQQGVWIGGGFVLLSAICYAFYLSGGKHLIVKYGSARFASSALLVSTVATFAHFLSTQRPSVLLHQPWEIYALSFAMGTFSTVLPVVTLAAAVRHIGSSSAALISSLGPVLTICFSWMLLNEAISLLQIIGTMLVIGGVWLIGEKGRKNNTAEHAKR